MPQREILLRRNLAFIGVAIATSLSSAHADITGYVYQDIHYVEVVDGFGAPDFKGTVIDLWLEVDGYYGTLIHVCNFNDVNLGVTYYQSFTGATWLPNNQGPPFETPALQYADSYVSAGNYNGGSQPNSNGTGLDPNFGGASAPGAAGPRRLVRLQLE